jgi:hypothetical protein
MAFRTLIDGIGAITETAPGGPFTTTGGIAADVIGSAADIILNNSVVAEGFAATASGADNEIDIAAGRCYVYNSAYATGGTEQKYWPVSNDATTAVVIPANVSGNPRIDLVCVYLNSAATPGDNGAANCSYVVVQGTPAATPVAPSVPADHCVIAQINVANGFTTIGNSDLTDRRQMYEPHTGWLPLPILPTYSSVSGLFTTLTYSGASTFFTKGDKIRITQGGSTKYFYVTALSGSTLTVTGGQDYTFSNSAVQTAYFSRANAPLGFPNRFELASPITGDVYLTMIGNRIILTGWGWFTGDGSNTLRTDTVAYGITLASIPIIGISLLGRKDGSNPTTPGDFIDTAALSSSNGIWATAHTATTSQFVAGIRVGAGVWTSSQRLGYSWRAEGII